MVYRQSVKQAKSSRVADIFYWLVLGITAANYSFITFSQLGDELLSQPLKSLAYARLPIVIVGCIYLLVGLKRHTVSVGVWLSFSALILFLLMTIPLSPDFQNAALYNTWFIFQTLFFILYISHLFATIGLERAKVKVALPLMFYGLYFVMLTFLALPRFSIGQPFPAVFSTRVQVAMICPLFLGGLACNFRLLSKRKIWLLTYIALAGFTLLVIAASGKRASILSALLIISTYFLLFMKMRGRILVAVLVPLAVVLIAMTELRDQAFEATEYTRDRVEKGFDKRTATSIMSRFEIWEVALEQVYDHPLGVGVGVGRVIVGGGLHNTYLGYLLETGILASIIVFVIIGVVLFSNFNSKYIEKKEMLYFILIPCLLYSLTEYNTSPGQPLFIPTWAAIFFCLLRSPSEASKLLRK